MYGADAPDFGAASDGDGDRNMILGRSFFVTPSDSLAVLAANAPLVPGYRRGPRRRRPLDADQPPRPTGSPTRSASPATRRRPAGSSSATCWMPARSRCAARKASAPAPNHVREKDGLWAVLFWLNILAVTRPVGASHRARALGRASAATTTRATTTKAIDTADGRCADGDAARASCRRPGRPGARGRHASALGRRLRLHRPGRRLGQPNEPGRAHGLRRRLAHRVPPVGHRHRRRHACASTSNVTNPTRPGTGSTPRRRSPP